MTVPLITDYAHGISAIDAQFHRPKRAAIHLIAENGKLALVDTGTTFSVPGVVKALEEKNTAQIFKSLAYRSKYTTQIEEESNLKKKLSVNFTASLGGIFC